MGPLTLRADSGFFCKYVVAACHDHHVRYSITVRQIPTATKAIEEITEDLDGDRLHDGWRGLSRRGPYAGTRDT
jgi:hypothetical protein